MGKKKRQHAAQHHPEAKGLGLIVLSLFVFLSLASFTDGNHETNWLGLLGYLIAYGLHYLLGLTSYLIAFYLMWGGWKLIKLRGEQKLKCKNVYFGIFLISLCILLNLGAERHIIDTPFLKSKVHSESVVIKSPYPLKYERYNFGGVPLYYVYKDIPDFSLQHILSDVGVFCTFFTLALVSFILLSEMSFFAIVKGVASFPLYLFNKLKPLARLAKDSIEKKPLEDTQKRVLKKVRNRPFEGEEEEEEEEETVKPIEDDPIDLPIKEHQHTSASIEKLSTKLKQEKIGKYTLPPLSLLTNATKVDQPSLKKDLLRQAEILEETLLSFGIEAKVGEVNCGPTITSFELHPAVGVKVQKIKALEKDIALNLQAKSIRILAPIPGKAVVGVEIPSPFPQEVGFKEMLASYRVSKNSFHIPTFLGKTVTGEDVMCDLTKMPHCIIAGATGSGKSVCINTIIMSILMNLSPDDVKLILVDPKKVELTPFTKLPHMIAPVITEPAGAYAALNWIVKEMQFRYELLKQLGVRNITAFNQRKINKEIEDALEIQVPERMHFIVAIIDEFADLMMSSNADLETPIARIAQMARAVGIHMILATQRPSREVITGIIKANFPSRISFKVASRVNSQIILDENGAESLLGNGDLLFLPPGSSQLLRAQGVFIRDEDINRVVDYICGKNSTNYLLKSFDELSQEDILSQEDKSEASDPLYEKALNVVLDHRVASTTFIQRKLKVGYARAAGLMDELEERGVIGPQDGSRPRKIFHTRADHSV